MTIYTPLSEASCRILAKELNLPFFYDDSSIEYELTSEGSAWNRGKELADWDKEKKSKARKKFLSDPIEKQKLLARAKMGSETSRKKLSKTYIITFPDGHQETITNLKDFCRKHNLNQGNMCSCASGRLKQHKGFKVSFPSL